MRNLESWPTSRLLFTAARLVELKWNKELQTLGLRLGSVIALEAVSANGPITQSELARVIRVRGQTIGPLLARLESLGYVTRRHSALDRRVHVVSLTPSGSSVLDNVRKLECLVLAEVSGDSEGFRQELKSIVRNLDSEEVSDTRSESYRSPL